MLSYAAMAAMMLLGWSADGATATQKKTPAKTASTTPAKTPAKTSTAKKQGTAAKKSAGVTPASKKGSSTGNTASAATHGKKAPVKSVTWRNRQTAPSPDRYREIQGALASKGYLNPDEATGNWNQSSADALKRFQEEQNLESNGKINSLSLIALGLGPRRDVTPAAKPAPPGQ